MPARAPGRKLGLCLAAYIFNTLILLILFACRLKDYSALRASPFGVALSGDRRHCVASSNPACFMSGVRIKSNARWRANCGFCTIVKGFAG
jgi:hypothetical protein